MFKRKEKNTRQISTEAKNKHLSEKTGKEQTNRLTQNSLEIKKMFLKPIKRILKYLPLKALGVTKASAPVQADGAARGGAAVAPVTPAGPSRLQRAKSHRIPPQVAGGREGSPSRSVPGTLGKGRLWRMRLVPRRDSQAGAQHHPDPLGREGEIMTVTRPEALACYTQV